MKTKITTIIGLVALGMISFTTNHATAANRQMSSITTVETQDNLTIEDCMQNTNLWTENAETKTAKAETVKSLEAEGLSEEDFLKAAESYTAAGSDREIEKYANQLTENSAAKAQAQKSLEAEARMTDNDFFMAAESYTASGSNTEVNNYVTKLIALEDARKEK